MLSSQEVALQVLSPLQGFTTVFGMGTGGLPAIGHQQTSRLLISFYSRPQLYAEDCIRYFHQFFTNSKIHSFTLWFSACAIKDCFVTSLPLRNNGGIAKPTLRHLLAFAYANATRGYASFIFFRKSPRPISISRLKMLPLLHL